jgi:hypothetical protein
VTKIVKGIDKVDSDKIFTRMIDQHTRQLANPWNLARKHRGLRVVEELNSLLDDIKSLGGVDILKSQLSREQGSSA